MSNNYITVFHIKFPYLHSNVPSTEFSHRGEKAVSAIAWTLHLKFITFLLPQCEPNIFQLIQFLKVWKMMNRPYLISVHFFSWVLAHCPTVTYVLHLSSRFSNCQDEKWGAWHLLPKSPQQLTTTVYYYYYCCYYHHYYLSLLCWRECNKPLFLNYSSIASHMLLTPLQLVIGISLVQLGDKYILAPVIILFKKFSNCPHQAYETHTISFIVFKVMVEKKQP